MENLIKLRRHSHIQDIVAFRCGDAGSFGLPPSYQTDLEAHRGWNSMWPASGTTSSTWRISPSNRKIMIRYMKGMIRAHLTVMSRTSKTSCDGRSTFLIGKSVKWALEAGHFHTGIWDFMGNRPIIGLVLLGKSTGNQRFSYCGWGSEILHHRKEGWNPLKSGMLNHLSTGDLDFATIRSRGNEDP